MKLFEITMDILRFEFQFSDAGLKVELPSYC